MSIEQRLKQEFDRQAQGLHPSSRIQPRMLDAFREQFSTESKRRLPLGRFRLPNVALFAVLFVLLSGFAYAGGKWLFVDDQGALRIAYRTAGESFALKHISAEQISRTSEQIKRQLAPGESAVVYFAELEKESNPIFRKLPILVVNKPETISDRTAWINRMKQLHKMETIPATLPDGFAFLEGAEGLPFGGTVSEEAAGLLEQLKKESKKTGSKEVWRKLQLPAVSPTGAYTTTYIDSKQQKLYLTVESVADDKVTVNVATPDSAIYEEWKVNGSKAHYTKNDLFLFSGSGQYQNVFWIETVEGQKRMISLGTDSVNVTKEQMFRAAESIRP